MLGECSECGKLTPIQGRTPKIRTSPEAIGARMRNLDYYPVPHEGPDGKGCLGHYRAIL